MILFYFNVLMKPKYNKVLLFQKSIAIEGNAKMWETNRNYQLINASEQVKWSHLEMKWSMRPPGV